MVKNVIKYKKGSNAVDRGDEWDVSQNGNRSRKHTTKGWYFEVEGADGTSSWVKLKDPKQDNPIEVAKYCKMKDLMEEPAIVW